MNQPWTDYLGEHDRAVLARGRFAQRMGFGARPAVIAIDCQRYMVGERGPCLWLCPSGVMRPTGPTLWTRACTLCL